MGTWDGPYPRKVSVHMTLDQAIAQLRAPPGRTLVGLSALAARIVMIDLHFSPVEARRLRSALSRVAVSPEEQEAIGRLVEEHALVLREVAFDDAAAAVHAGLGDGAGTAYDALVDLAAAAGVLHGVFPLMAALGATTPPADRAQELGIEVPAEGAFVGVSKGSIRFDDRSFTIGDQLYEVTIGWSNLILLEARDPWPRVHVAWRERGYGGDAFFTARWDAEAFAARIEALFQFARERVGEHGAHRIERGWVGRPDVSWEKVAALPDDNLVANHGAYRTSARARPTEPIVARREAPTSLERLVIYLGSGQEVLWRDQVGAIVVTDTHLYAERRGGIGRLPLSTLRARLGGRDGLYIFGARTRVLLPQRAAPCPVAQHLDAVLRARA